MCCQTTRNKCFEYYCLKGANFRRVIIQGTEAGNERDVDEVYRRGGIANYLQMVAFY